MRTEGFEVINLKMGEGQGFELFPGSLRRKGWKRNGGVVQFVVDSFSKVDGREDVIYYVRKLSCG